MLEFIPYVNFALLVTGVVLSVAGLIKLNKLSSDMATALTRLNDLRKAK